MVFELPIDKKTPTMAELKEKNIKWRTMYYNLLSGEQKNQFMADMQDIVNNPFRYSIVEFSYVTLIDGTPTMFFRIKEDFKIEEIKDRKFDIFCKLFTTAEFKEMDEIINDYDQTNLFLLGEKRITMKGGDFFILLIWATKNAPTKSMEGLNALKHLFSGSK